MVFTRSLPKVGIYRIKQDLAARSFGRILIQGENMNAKPDIMRLNKDVFYKKYSTPNKPHNHTKWELVIFEKGETDNVVNNVKYDAIAGDAFLLGPPHKHEIVFRSTPHLHRDMYFTEEEVKEACDSLSPTLFSEIAAGEILVTFHLPSATHKAVIEQEEHLEALSFTLQNNKHVCIEDIKRINLSVLKFLLGIYETQKLLKVPTYPAWLIKIIQLLYLPENFTKPANEIIAMTYYSHATVSKAFRQYLGVTLADYLVNLRLEHAAELLRNTSYTVLHICSLCGYDSLSYFIKQFRKKYGATPHKFRKLAEQ